MQDETGRGFLPQHQRQANEGHKYCTVLYCNNFDYIAMLAVVTAPRVITDDVQSQLPLGKRYKSSEAMLHSFLLSQAIFGLISHRTLNP